MATCPAVKHSPVMGRKGTKMVLVGPKRSKLFVNGMSGKDGMHRGEAGRNQKIKKVISSHARTIWSGI